jgi:hypothetical protein
MGDILMPAYSWPTGTFWQIARPWKAICRLARLWVRRQGNSGAMNGGTQRAGAQNGSNGLPGAPPNAAAGELCFGVDSCTAVWRMLWRLGGAASVQHLCAICRHLVL